MGGFRPGGFCPGGFCLRGDFVRGVCPGGFCPRNPLFNLLGLVQLLVDFKIFSVDTQEPFYNLIVIFDHITT